MQRTFKTASLPEQKQRRITAHKIRREGKLSTVMQRCPFKTFSFSDYTTYFSTHKVGSFRKNQHYKRMNQVDSISCSIWLLFHYSLENFSSNYIFDLHYSILWCVLRAMCFILRQSAPEVQATRCSLVCSLQYIGCLPLFLLYALASFYLPKWVSDSNNSHWRRADRPKV